MITNGKTRAMRGSVRNGSVRSRNPAAVAKLASVVGPCDIQLLIVTTVEPHQAI